MFQLSAQQFSDVLAALRAAGASSGSEKRRFTRMEVQARVAVARLFEGKVARIYTALTRDVSAGGMGLMQYAQFEAGEPFIVRLPLGKQSLDVLAVSTFCRPLAEGMFGIGSRFAGPISGELAQSLARSAEDELARIRQSVLG